jgi:hypothetical protein
MFLAEISKITVLVSLAKQGIDFILCTVSNI